MIDSLDKLLNAPCNFIPKSAVSMSEAEIQQLMKLIKGWQISETGQRIQKSFKFDSYLESIEFVQQIAEIAEQTDHHPDIWIGFKECRVEYWTYTVKGISVNDFICAAKIDHLTSSR